MSWDDTRCERFVEATLSMARGRLPGYGRPHVVLPYPPEEERTCIAALRTLLPDRLTRAGIPSCLVPVGAFAARARQRWAQRDLTDVHAYRDLENDLSDVRDGLVARTARLVAKEHEATSADTVLIVCRVGALHPFGHLSALLEALYSAGLHHTIAVAYPGTADGIQLRFLGRSDPTGGYRGHVVT